MKRFTGTTVLFIISFLILNPGLNGKRSSTVNGILNRDANTYYPNHDLVVTKNPLSKAETEKIGSDSSVKNIDVPTKTAIELECPYGWIAEGQTWYTPSTIGDKFKAKAYLMCVLCIKDSRLYHPFLRIEVCFENKYAEKFEDESSVHGTYIHGYWAKCTDLRAVETNFKFLNHCDLVICGMELSVSPYMLFSSRYSSLN